MKISIVLLSLVLSSCVQETIHEVPGSKSVFVVDCSGADNNWQSCYTNIANSCGAYGYEVISSTLDGNSIRGNVKKDRSIRFKCMK